MFCHLTADERTTRLTATLGDAAHHLRDVLAPQLADGDVVEEEQWLRATGQNVVDAHGDQIYADGVVLAGHLRQGELGANTIRAAHEDGIVHLFERSGREQTAESTDVADDLGTIRRLHARANRIDGAGTLVNVDAGILVGDLFCHACSSCRNETVWSDRIVSLLTATDKK